ncbi:hypothetical protein CI102_9132 [Trichoderma harzianum]|nr:hypothetical protein CI102_9132 [Trichoderma harzianum]
MNVRPATDALLSSHFVSTACLARQLTTLLYIPRNQPCIYCRIKLRNSIVETQSASQSSDSAIVSSKNRRRTSRDLTRLGLGNSNFDVRICIGYLDLVLSYKSLIAKRLCSASAELRITIPTERGWLICDEHLYHCPCPCVQWSKS